MLSGLQVGILVTEANVVLIGLPVFHSAMAGDQSVLMPGKAVRMYLQGQEQGPR